MRIVGYLSTIITVSILWVFICISTIKAQSYNTESWGFEIGSGVPFTSFNEANQMEPVYNFSFSYDINPSFSILASFNKGLFRNVNKINWFGRTFQNHYTTFGIKPRVNLVNIFDTGNKLKRLDVYAFSGLGILHNNVKTSLNPDLSMRPAELKSPNIQKFAGIDNKTNALYYSLGIGMKYNLTSRIGIFVQYEYNLTNSDYVDGYTTIYNSTSGPNNYSNDNYSLLTGGISIRIGGGRKTFKRNSSIRQNSPNKLSADSLLFKKLAELIQKNGKAIKETNNQLYTTNLIFRNFVNRSSSDQILVKNDKIKGLQEQIDSLKTMRAQVDYLSSKVGKEDQKYNTNLKLPKYFIIADAFLELSKAHSLLEKLKNIGYNDAQVINDNTNVWYLVAYAEVGNQKAAGEILDKIKAYQNPSAWIYANK